MNYKELTLEVVSSQPTCHMKYVKVYGTQNLWEYMPHKQKVHMILQIERSLLFTMLT